MGISILLALTMFVSRDRSITRGIHDQAQWSERLAAVVPLGSQPDSARHLLERSGFTCGVDSNRLTYLWCDRLGSNWSIVRTDWRAILTLQNGRVANVQAVLSLTGP